MGDRPFLIILFSSEKKTNLQPLFPILKNKVYMFINSIWGRYVIKLKVQTIAVDIDNIFHSSCGLKSLEILHLLNYII